MLRETSTTITPDEPAGTIVRRCTSNDRTDTTVATSAATAAAASTSRTSLVRRATPRSAVASCVSIASLRRRRIVLAALLGRCFLVEVLAHALGEADGLGGRGLAPAPRQRARRRRERPVALVEVLRDELERSSPLGRSVERGGLLEQRERALERREVGRRRRGRRLGRGRLLTARDRRVGEPAAAERQRCSAGEEQRDQQRGRQAVRRGRQ